MTLQDTSTEFRQQCRAAMAAEQAQSLAATNQWAHVDKAQVHSDWDALYKELAPLIDAHAPASPTIQALIARHHAIAQRFYTPSREAYIGFGLFYQDDPAMRDFHNRYHPRMVELLGEAIYAYAQGMSADE